jgi:hypothetical protein
MDPNLYLNVIVFYRLIMDYTRIEPTMSIPAMAASIAPESQSPVAAVVSSK